MGPVLEKAEEIQSQIDAGLKAAGEYKAKYGGLTGIDTILTEVDFIFRDPLAGVIAQWNGTENVLVNAPNGLPATDVAQRWYDNLKTSYEGLARELEALEKELAVPT